MNSSLGSKTNCVVADTVASSLSLIFLLSCLLHVFSEYFFLYSQPIMILVAAGYSEMSLNCYSAICRSGDRGGTVVKALCYKSEGRWFYPI